MKVVSQKRTPVKVAVRGCMASVVREDVIIVPSFLTLMLIREQRDFWRTLRLFHLSSVTNSDFTMAPLYGTWKVFAPNLIFSPNV